MAKKKEETSRTASFSSTSTSSSIGLSNYLSFVHYNIQSLLPKLDLLSLELKHYDLIAFTETWLNKDLPSSEILFDLYKEPERKDRDDSYGGVALYIKNNVFHKRRSDLEIPGVECIWVELVLRNKHILFGVFYRPPNSTAVQHLCIIDSIHLAVDTGIQDIVITGDFNLNIRNPASAAKIQSICEQFSLIQIITSSTNFTESSESIIDLIFTSNNDLIQSSGVADPFLQQNIRYHCPIYGVFSVQKPCHSSFYRHVWLLDKGDYDKLRRLVADFNWESIMDDDIDTYTSNITSTIIELSKHCIPYKKVCIRDHEPPWFNNNIRLHIRRRKRAYRKARGSNSEHSWERFRTLRNETTYLIKTAKHKYYLSLADKLKSQNNSSKTWWSCLKSFMQPTTAHSIPPLQSGLAVIDDNMSKADLLNDFFRDQTLIDESSAPDLTEPGPSDFPGLHSLVISPVEVSFILKSLPLGKASGPDGINNRILRELSLELSHPLSSLFNFSLTKGIFPSSWKEAHVCPIFKSGDPSLVNNYRPISLLSTLGKVFERVIFKHTYNYLHENHILTSLQSGFTPGDSTINQLTFLYNMFSQALDSGKEIRAVFCDISKAFDRVWHDGLLYKLKLIGVSGNVLSWFTSYLTGRKQRVVLPGTQSAWNDITAGVPQGSILGPLLFLIYINDIVSDINARIRLFADDTSLFLIVEDPSAAAAILNEDLQKISTWASKWLVRFNPNKTESLIITRKTRPLYRPPIFMLDVQINQVASHKHLGIFLSSDLHWTVHINYIKTKCWKRINIMHKLKFILDRKSLETIYISFIRPILEYGDILFDNCSQQEKQDLESIQHEAARIVTGATKLVSISKLMKEVGWDTLDMRRHKHKLIQFYKMKNHLSPEYLCDLVPQTVGDSNSYWLRNASQYVHLPSRTSYHSHSFLPSVIRSFNDLPARMQEAESLLSFKSLLNGNVTPVPPYYYQGDRQLQILHMRIRTNCSALASDLFDRNLVDCPNCSACGEVENSHHFFLQCQRYTGPRIQLQNEISQYCTPTLYIMLFGDPNLSPESNTSIFKSVQNFIRKTKRF